MVSTAGCPITVVLAFQILLHSSLPCSWVMVKEKCYISKDYLPFIYWAELCGISAVLFIGLHGSTAPHS